MGERSLTVLVVLLLASCAGATERSDDVVADPGEQAQARLSPTSIDRAASSRETAPVASPSATVRLAFVGDLMLGRGVGEVVAADPASVFERLRPALVGADLAFGNLESPLTTRRHLVGEHALEADPSAARLLAGAGFDVLGVANNHAADAGAVTVLDSIAALEDAGLTPVGGGESSADAAAPVIVEVGGLRLGIVAFDLAGGRSATATTAGVNPWNVDQAEAVVTALSTEVDVIIAGVHGGVEYLVRPDPVLTHVTGLLAEWGTDVVWGHGAHVAYPVGVDGPGWSVVAPGLGNALFDQPWPRTSVGALLEVLIDADGPIAFRTGRIAIGAGRSAFDGWDEPAGDAVAFDGDWWTPVRGIESLPPRDLSMALPQAHEIVARAAGDITGTGEVDLVISYRRPATPEPVHAAFPQVDWVDSDGRTAHLAVRTATGRLRWGSAVMFQPVGTLAVCDGSVALGFTAIDDASVVAGGAWLWDGFGFRTSAVLPGSATAGCADVDGDGRSEPVLVDRSPDLPARDRPLTIAPD